LTLKTQSGGEEDWQLGSLTDELLGLEKMKEDEVKRRICP
jgi:hypothetical protein